MVSLSNELNEEFIDRLPNYRLEANEIINNRGDTWEEVIDRYYEQELYNDDD